MKLVLGVVLYANQPFDSITLQSLSSIDFESIGLEVLVHVRDNSTIGYGVAGVSKVLNGLDFFYDFDSENLSLSKVYNRIVSMHNYPNAFVFLDDDSVVTKGYFVELLKFLKSSSSIAIPTINFRGEMISPGRIEGVRGKKLNTNDIVTSKENRDLVAMMSGTVVKSSVFNLHKLKFDERLSIYGVDTKFFLDSSDVGLGCYVLDYRMEHDSALRALNYEFNKMYFRFSNLMQAQFIIHENKRFYKLSLFLYFPFFIIAKVLRLKDIRFLKLFKNYKFFWKLNR